MADNTVTLVGNLTRDPELRFTAGGRGVASFGMAVNRRYQVNGEWQEQTSFFNVIAWGTLGENAAASLTKGTRIIVTGRLEQREYETKDGEKRNVVEIVADELGPSLRWAHAEVERTSAHRSRRRLAGDGGAGADRPAAADPPILSTATKSRSDPQRTSEKAIHDDQQEEPGPAAEGHQPRSSRRRRACSSPRRSIYVDYKDVNLLHRFVSDRAKIRNRRVTRQHVQQQREVANAVKIAREMALLPYTKPRVDATHRGHRDRVTAAA